MEQFDVVIGAGSRQPEDMMSTSAQVEEARVELWRFERLLQAQCLAPAAMTLATRRDVDLHAAVGLLEVGCPSRTILDILL